MHKNKHGACLRIYQTTEANWADMQAAVDSQHIPNEERDCILTAALRVIDDWKSLCLSLAGISTAEFTEFLSKESQT